MRRSTRIVWFVITACLFGPGPIANAAFPGRNGDIAFGRSSKGQVDIWVTNAGCPSPAGSRTHRT